LISAHEAAAASAGGLALALPPERAIVQSRLLTVVLKGGPGAFEEIRVSVNDMKQAVAPRSFKQNTACYEGIRLSPGMNTIRIAGFKKGKKIEEITTQVFFYSELSDNSRGAPAGFKKYSFHVGGNEKKCASCHALDFSKAADQQEPARSPCYQCHKKILSEFTVLHPPAAEWSCLMCHDGKAKNPKLAVAEPDDKSCSNCHDTSWGGKKYLHAPTAAGACTTCHNPHAADRPYVLRKETVDLCASCHAEILLQPHVIAGFSGNGGHPLKKSPDPFNPAKDFTCASCHNPHASNSEALLEGFDDSMSMKQFCLSCHKNF
ncbi:MAG TPA: cytochrome c3 family protein, partial [Nitrospirota bacterium]